MRAFTSLLALLLLLGSGTTLYSQSDAEPEARSEEEESDAPMLSNPLSYPERMLDRLVLQQSKRDFEKGESRRVEVQNDARGHVVLADDNKSRYPRSGRWISPVEETEFPFTELVPSWNVETPEETGFILHVRVRDKETQEWSPWLYLGQWGRTVHWPSRTISFEHGRVNVDNIVLKQPADAFQSRASLYSFDLEGEANPLLRRIGVSYSGVVSDEERYEELHQPAIVDGPWDRSLPIPFNAQYNNGVAIRGETCSPTATTMVLRYYGIDVPVLENCLAIYDKEYAIFGNWARATARAGEFGLDAWVTRVRTRDEVKKYISAGIPVVASIKFGEGEFPSNPMDSTGGHLIVIRGLTEEGDAIVNDPALREEGNGIVYKWDELKRAWIDHGGVAYIIQEPTPRSAGM